MLQSTIIKLSNTFLKEASHSPSLLADLAMMEKYMSESYSNRIIIELLQNADDAGATSVYISRVNDTIIFANNGRPFSERDVISISRSGQSSKKRGDSIGYRGVGFKSASFLSSDIIIHSGNVNFTFSKRRTAMCLGMSEGNVPTIRIPFILEDHLFDDIINRVKAKGFNTIFLFTSAESDIINEELDLLDSDFMLFLKHVNNLLIEIPGHSKKIKVKRIQHAWGQEVVINDKSWAMFYNQLAFKLENMVIEECNCEESIYYCFLPTYDKFLFPFKVNADFSTDPSRKHVILDEKTKDSLQAIGDAICSLVTEVFQTPIPLYKNLLTILENTISFSKVNMYLKKVIDEKLQNQKCTIGGRGDEINISDYKLFSSDFDKGVVNMIRKQSVFAKDFSISSNVYASIDGVDEFIKQYSSSTFNAKDLVKILSEKNFIGASSDYIYSYLLGKVFLAYQKEKYISSEKLDLSTMYFKGKSDVIRITNASCDQIRDVLEKNDSNQSIIESLFKEIIVSLGINYVAKPIDIDGYGISNDTNNESEKFKSNSLMPGDLKGVKIHSDSNSLNQHSNEVHFDHPIVPSWRSAEYACVKIEEFLGNEARDVSRQNVGYDVESRTPSGEMRYIEVKFLTNSNSFSMTSNEYAVASQYGDEYYLCLIQRAEHNSKAIYIRNPHKNLSFVKRIKQWEWFCDTVKGETINMEY